MRAPDSLELRRLALAVSVLDDVDIVPLDDGVLLTGDTAGRGQLAGAAPRAGRRRPRGRARPGPGPRLAARPPDRGDRAPRPPAGAGPAGRPAGRPPDAPRPRLGAAPGARRRARPRLRLRRRRQRPRRGRRHPAGRTRRRRHRPDALVAGGPRLPRADGRLAAERTGGQPRSCARSATATSSRCSGRAIAARGTVRRRTAPGMRAAAVPMRRRGWLDLTRIDPAFTAAAAAATTREERGFARPVLLTARRGDAGARGRPPGRDRPARRRRRVAAPAVGPLPLTDEPHPRPEASTVAT